MHAYLGVDVTALSEQSLLLGMYLFVYGLGCWWWHQVGIDLWHTDTDPITRVGKSFAFPVMTLVLAVNPCTVALWLAAPGLVLTPAGIALVRMLWVVGTQAAHLLRVAYLQPIVTQQRAISAARRPGLSGPAVRVLQVRQQASLEQAAAGYAWDHHPGGPVVQSESWALPAADRIVRGIEQRRDPQ